MVPNPLKVEFQSCLSYKEHKEMNVPVKKKKKKIGIPFSSHGISKLTDYP